MIHTPLSQINRNLHRLVFALDRQAEEALQKHFSLTFSSFRILMAINHYGQLCQANVAKFHGLTPAAVSRQVEVLVEKKLISIEQDSKNRRQNILKLTALGKSKAKQGLELLDKHFSKALSELSSHEQQVFIEAINKLVGTMCEGKKH